MTMGQLEYIFNNAIDFNNQYIAVLVQMEGFEKPELIINRTENFEKKLEYYKKAYNDNLELKTFSGIKIIDCARANTLGMIESLIFV